MTDGHRILLVDDEPENLRALKRELHRWAREHAVTIDTCGDGASAAKQLRDVDYSVLLTDNRMPGMSGTQLVRVAAEIRPTCVRIILTGYTQRNDVEAALGAGIFSFLVKPWDRVTLRTELEQAIEVSEMRRLQRDQEARIEQDEILVRELDRRLKTVFPFHGHGHGRRGIVPSFAFRPTEDDASGHDFFDIRYGPDGGFTVLVGSSSGVGMQSVFMSALLKGVLIPEYLTQRRWFKTPSAFLTWLNGEIFSLTSKFPGLFMTLGCAIVSPDSDTVLFSSAGSRLPLHRRGKHVTTVEQYGVALGINGAAVYSDTEIDLEHGDSFYLYTNGLYLPGDGTNRADRDAIYQALISAPEDADTVDGIIDSVLKLSDVTSIHSDITLVELAAH